MSIQLEICAGPEVTWVFLHPGPRCRIGRNPDGEVALVGRAIESVSFDHARIELTADGARLLDAGSTNGTYLNGLRITDAMPLRRGDEVRLGRLGPILRIRALGRLLALVPDPPRGPQNDSSIQDSGKQQSTTQMLRKILHRNSGKFLITVAVAIFLLARRWVERFADNPALVEGCLAALGLIAAWVVLWWRDRRKQARAAGNGGGAPEATYDPADRRGLRTPAAY